VAGKDGAKARGRSPLHYALGGRGEGKGGWRPRNRPLRTEKMRD